MKLSLQIVEFNAALRACLLHASDDVTRRHLNAVQISLLADGRVDMVATDGHRLAIYRFGFEGCGKPEGSSFSILVAKDDAEAWLKIAGKDKQGTIEIDDAARTMTAYAPVRVFTWTLVDAQFPPYVQVLPDATSAHVAAVNPAYLADACKAFAILSKALPLADKDATAGILMRAGSADARASERELAPVQVTSPAYPQFGIIVMPMRVHEYRRGVEHDKVILPLKSTFAVPASKKAA